MNTLKCKICGGEYLNLGRHIFCSHSTTVSEYREKYGNVPMLRMSDKTKKKISDSVNLWYSNPNNKEILSEKQKNGSSIFTDKYWKNKGFSDDDAKKKVSEIQRANSKKSSEKMTADRSCFKIEYWKTRHGMSDSEAKAKITEIQSELSSRSSKFFGKKRTLYEKDKISKSMKKYISEIGNSKWASHFGEFGGTSKLEKNIFNYIKKNINNLVESNIEIGQYIVDIFDKRSKKIVEVYGDFWHANPRFYNENKIINETIHNMTAGEKWQFDLDRENYLRSNGYDILIVWEYDWNNHMEETLNIIRNFYEDKDKKYC